ncbi:MAG: carboxypeptidase regulatory-like domain-containing protein [Bacteroidales bacterium]|nr:carboxypeptidase regulatory-like domain-containing protein [Bacteroidales bacterium]
MKKMKLVMGVVLVLALGLFSTSCKKEVATGKIQGLVTNYATSEPIQGVNISLSPTGASAVTGSDGRYEFNNLEPGNYTVQGTKSGFESNTKNITITSGNVSSGDMQLRPAATGFRLNVDYLDFGTNFTQMSFKIINVSTTNAMSWEIVESLNWLETSPSTGSIQGGQETTVNVAIDRSLLSQTTTANITVRSADHSVVLPINVTVSGDNAPQLQLSETTLDFGTTANNLSFSVMNVGPNGTTLNWTCSNITVDWLTLSPTSGSTAGGNSTMVMATIDRTKFNGIVSTSVTVNGAGMSSTIVFNAQSEGSGVAILQLSENALDFGEQETAMTFQVRNIGTNSSVLDWTISTPAVNWLTISPMSGSTVAGNASLVTVLIDRSMFSSDVSTNITVSGGGNTASIAVSAKYFDNTIVVGEGLYCFFNFDEQDIVDYNGNYTGINAGAVPSSDTPSGQGKSMQFDGNSFILVQNNIVPTSTNYTISYWFKTTSSGQYMIGSDKYGSDLVGTYDECVIAFTTSSKYFFRFANWRVHFESENTMDPYFDNQWHMLTFTFNGAMGMVYLDGVLKGTHVNTNYMWDAPTATYFGSNCKMLDGKTNFNGKLDNFRSYSRALSATEIQALYNARQ